MIRLGPITRSRMLSSRFNASRLALLTLAIGAHTTLAQNGSEIRGTVTASETHAVVIGARVAIASPERVAISDQRGTYVLRNLPAGTYRVITTAIGRKPD